jgi:hypothetical protein
MKAGDCGMDATLRRPDGAARRPYQFAMILLTRSRDRDHQLAVFFGHEVFGAA